MESIHGDQNPKSNIVHCPFNTSHTMPQKTLLLHLTKCPDKKKNQKLSNYLVNSSSTASTGEHVEQGPSGLKVDQTVIKSIKINHSNSHQDFSNIVEDSTWNDIEDTNSPDQDSNNTIKNMCYMKPPPGLTKSERKKYSAELRQTMSNVATSNNPSFNKNYVNQSEQKKNNRSFTGRRSNT